jgi:hypothetical protein
LIFFSFFFSLFCFFCFPTPQARAFLESLVLFNYRVFVCDFWACISGGLLFLCVFLCCNFVGNLWVALRLYQCYVSCVPDMEVTKVPQNRAQLELIAQGGGAAAKEREIRFQALLLVRRLTLLQVSKSP